MWLSFLSRKGIKKWRTIVTEGKDWSNLADWTNLYCLQLGSYQEQRPFCAIQHTGREAAIKDLAQTGTAVAGHGDQIK
jgi:hypothetical protein